MIRVIESLPDGVIGFVAAGKVTAEDYETVLMPAVGAATADASKARLLLVFGPDFDGYEAEAALDDIKMGVRDWNDFHRIAFVSDHSLYRAMVKGMGFLMPGEVRVFPLDDLENAKQWVGA